MTEDLSKRRRPQVVRLSEQTDAEPAAKPAPDEAAPPPRRKPAAKKPRAPRTMVAPEPEKIDELKFDDIRRHLR